MSAHDQAEQHVEGAPHATFDEYLIGFCLSAVLTIIPFWIVLGDVFESANLKIFIIISFGIVQMVVHMIYFLHLNTKSEAGWILISLAFTLMLVVIAIAGSVWIMWHLDRNMMPLMIEAARALP